MPRPSRGTGSRLSGAGALAQLGISHADDNDGGARSFDPRITSTLTALSNANDVVYHRAKGAKAGATGLYVYVGTSSGNISVAVFANNGSATLAARPSGNRKATSGAVACPAGNDFTFVPFLASTDIAIGDWLALSCDNTTATFLRSSPGGVKGLGVCYREATGHPAPSSVGTLADSVRYFFLST